jgi:hypothetical protein
MNTNNENYVIVRADKAGVFFGQLVNKQGDEITLNNCRKLWYWKNACAVEQLALDGVLEATKNECKFTVTVNNAIIMNVIQIIPCSDKAIKSIQSIPSWSK